MTAPATTAALEAPSRIQSSTRRSILILVLIWAGWAVALLLFQEIVLARVGPERPDPVLEWTASETGLQRATAGRTSA